MASAARKKKVKSLNLDSGSKSKAEKYTVTGLEGVVPQIREIDAQVEKLGDQRRMMKDMILNKVTPIKAKEEKRGRLYKTFVVESDDGVPARVLFKNAFSKIPLNNEDDMRGELGEHFDELYEIQQQVVMRRGAKMEDLKKLLGKKFEDFFTESGTIAHKKDFMERRADLRQRGQLNKRTNDALDQYTKDCQATPDLRMK